MNTSVPPDDKPCLDVSHVEDLKLAASKLLGSQRRSFQAAMAVKYCQGNPRPAEEVFGWSRHTVALGLHKRRTGILCLGAQEASCGNKRWEERHPEAAAALRALAETHSQPDPTFRTPLYYPRLTAAEAIQQLRALGFAEAVLPSPSTMAQVLHRNGYRLRPVLKAKPPKKSPRRMPSLPTSGHRMHLPRPRVQPNA
jgi:hypothetical protein